MTQWLQVMPVIFSSSFFMNISCSGFHHV